MPTRLYMKRGDTFEVEISCVDGAGVAQDLTGYSARSQLRFGDDSPIELTVTIDPDQAANAGLVTLAHGGSTASWPVMTGLLDLELTDPDGRIESSETIELYVAKDITR